MGKCLKIAGWQIIGMGNLKQLDLTGSGVVRVAIAVGVSLLMVFPALATVQAQNAEEELGTWFPTMNIQVDRSVTSSFVLPDGRVFVSARTPRMYDPYSGDITIGTAHPEANLEFGTGWRQDTRILAADGRAFIAGGIYDAGISPGSTGSTDRAAMYDPQSDVWNDVAMMPERRSSHSLTLLEDGSILAAGGERAGGIQIGMATYVLPGAIRYVPEESGWTDAGELNEPRINHQSVKLDDGRVLIVGGRSGPAELASTVEVFDPEENSWEILVDEIPDELMAVQAIAMHDGKILVLGGFDSETDDNAIRDGTNVWLLDPETGGIERLASMNEPRAEFRAAILNDGSVLVTGGYDAGAGGRDPINTAELYIPNADEWQAVSSMERARQRHQMLALGEDAQGASALVVGGVDSQTEIGAPEVFYLDPPGIADRQPPPSISLPSHRYYPIVGHFLSHGFKDFWDRSGGLPVFGYPLTTEFDEYNPELDADRTSQYFERQRFEYHPEHAGTPYETQLGRLGYAEAVGRDLLEHDAFQPLDETGIDGDCEYFPATGHAACGSFLSYWQSHGLDFGDGGVSFRESLALFGYPISREFTDPDTGLTTQYFERARFEFHPDNPAEHQVLLGRLGADIVDQRDW